MRTLLFPDRVTGGGAGRPKPLSANPVTQTHSPPAPIQLNYAAGGTATLPPWLHLCIIVLMMGAGWLGFPLLIMTTASRYLRGLPWYLIALLFISSAFAGLLPAILFRKYVPARCDTCGGPAYYESMRPMLYVCQTCGRGTGRFEKFQKFHVPIAGPQKPP